MKLTLSTNIQELTYKYNRMWWWWWSTQLGEVKELAEPDRGADIRVLGDAGVRDLGKQGLDSAYNPVVVGDADLYEDGESIPNRTVTKTSISESAAAKMCPRPLVSHDES